MARANFEPLKEPKGFIKFLEFILAIFAFATTTSYSSHLTFKVFCCPKPAEGVPACPGNSQTITWSYPFELDKSTFPGAFCNGTGGEEKQHPYGDFSSSAEFYVFIGVMAFLYSIGALVLYIFFDDMYRNNQKIPVIDFVVSAVLTFMWLVSASAWADGVNDLKYYSSSAEIFLRHIDECKSAGSYCEEEEKGNYASLNVSIIFGFLNMAVWAGNLWFLFKETHWHKDHQSPSPNAMPSPSSADKGGQSPYGGGSDVYNSSNPYGGAAPPTNTYGGAVAPSNPYGSQGAIPYGGPTQGGNPYGPPSQVAPSYMSQPPQGRI